MGSVLVDTVLNETMHPVFAKEPDEVRRRLRHPYSETWTHVLIGESKQIVTIPEYVYRESLELVVRDLKELVSRKDLAMYKRDPSRWEDQLVRTAVKLIKRIQDEK